MIVIGIGIRIVVVVVVVVVNTQKSEERKVLEEWPTQMPQSLVS